MNKTLEIVKFSFECIFYLLITIISIMFIWASITNIAFSEKVKDFIDSAEFEEERDNVIYYTVKDKTITEDTIYKKDYEDNMFEPPVLGAPGDIFVMPQSRMEVVPFFSQFITYLFGGHGGVVSDNEQLIEPMGGTIEENSVYLNETDLYSEERTVIGLRVNASKEDKEKALQTAKGLVGKSYNYWYIFNTKDSFYCTDICSRIYSKEFGLNYKLDKNGFHTTVGDLFFSKDTNISFVKYKHNGKTYIYYFKNS